jgi:hypothetical protein
MATLEQIAEALKRADAAGDVDDAKKLAQAYRDMKAQQAGAGGVAQAPHAPAMPAPPNPASSGLPGVFGQLQNTARAAQSGAMQGMTLGWGDEINAGLMTPIEMGIDAFQGKGFDPGRSFNQALQKNRALDQGNAALNPAANLTGELAGGVLTAGKGIGLAKDALLGAAYGAGSANGDLQDRAWGAATGGIAGGVMGKVIPAVFKTGGKVVENALQKRATNAAIKAAPDAADLKAVSRAMFQAVDNSGVTADTSKLSSTVMNLVQQVKRERINPTLDPKSHAAYEEVIGALGDAQASGNPLTVSDIHTLRQIAQRAAVSSEGRDAMFANRLVDALDHFVTQPGSLRLPPNRLGAAPSTAAGNELLKAISTWGRARRTSLIEEAIAKAQNYPSGLESGLRAQFKSLLNNDRTRHLFTATEREAMQRVVGGTLSVKALRTLGLFKGFGGAGIGSIFGTAFGPMGTAIGGALGGAAGVAGRKITERSTEQAAQRAGRVVATPNIPQITLNNPLAKLSGAPFAMPIIDQTRQPLRITIRGTSAGRS